MILSGNACVDGGSCKADLKLSERCFVNHVGWVVSLLPTTEICWGLGMTRCAMSPEI